MIEEKFVMRNLKIWFLVFFAVSTLVACADEADNIDSYRLIGRFEVSAGGHASSTWSQTAMEFRFKGIEASLGISSSKRLRFSVEVDSNTSDLWVESGENVYILATGLSDSEHIVRVTRISEASNGITTFTTPPIVDGTLLALPKPYTERRLLVFGDSITAGYGVEGSNAECHYSMETSNSSKTYAALAAKFLDADLHAIAWSGIGTGRFYGETISEKPTIIDRYNLTLGDNFDSRWDPSQYVPNAVIVNIGTNDFWDGSAGNYEQTMPEFISLIANDYPSVPIYLIVSPMLVGDARVQQARILSSLSSDNVSVLDLGANDHSAGVGCDNHPNTPNQLMLASNLFSRLKFDLDW